MMASEKNSAEFARVKKARRCIQDDPRNQLCQTRLLVKHAASKVSTGYAEAMLSGKRYRLNAPTLAIDSSGERRMAITIPEGETIEVIRGPRPDDMRMVDVEWNGKELVMFLADVQDRGEYIGGRTAGA